MSIRGLMVLILVFAFTGPVHAQHYPELTVDQIKKMSPQALLKLEEQIEATYYFHLLYGQYSEDHQHASHRLRDSNALDQIKLTGPLPLPEIHGQRSYHLGVFLELIQRLPEQRSYYHPLMINLVTHDHREIASKVIRFYINSGESARPWIHLFMPHFHRLYSIEGDEAEKLAAFGPVMIPYLLDLLAREESHFFPAMAVEALSLIHEYRLETIPHLEIVWLKDHRNLGHQARQKLIELLARHYIEHPEAYRQFLKKHHKTKSKALKYKLGQLQSRVEILKPRRLEEWLKLYQNKKLHHDLRFHALCHFPINDVKNQELWLNALAEQDQKLLRQISSQIRERRLPPDALIPTLKQLLLDDTYLDKSVYFDLIDDYTTEEMMPLLPTVIQLTQHRQAKISRESLEALHRFGPRAKEAWPLLRKMLQDKSLEAYTRETALYSLMHIAPHEAWLTEEIANHLKRFSSNSFDFRSALRKLSYQREHAGPAIPVLMHYLNDETRRYMVIEALSNIGPAAMPAAEQVLRLNLDLPAGHRDLIPDHLQRFVRSMKDPILPLIIRLLKDERISQLGKQRLIVMLDHLDRDTDRQSALPILQELAKDEAYSALALNVIYDIKEALSRSSHTRKTNRHRLQQHTPSYEDFKAEPSLIRRYIHSRYPQYHAYALRALDGMPSEKRFPFLIENLYFAKGWRYNNPMPLLVKRSWYSQEIHPALVKLMRNPKADIKQRRKAIEILAHEARYSHRAMMVFLNEMKDSSQFSYTNNEKPELETMKRHHFMQHVDLNFGLYGLVFIQQLLHSKNEEDHELAHSLISSMGPMAYPLLPHLLKLAKAENFKRDRIPYALYYIGHPAVKPMLKLYQEASAHEKLNIIEWFGKHRSEAYEALPLLMANLREPSLSLRVESMKALKNMKPAIQVMLPLIKEGINDPSEKMRLQSIIFLSKYHEKEMLPILPLILSVITDPDEMHNVRIHAIDLFKWIDSDLALPHAKMLKRLESAAQNKEDRLNQSIQVLIKDIQSHQQAQQDKD